MSLPIKIIIESVIHRLNEQGVGIYVTHSGDTERGTIYIKTQNKNSYNIHSRVYDFNSDDYVWESKVYYNEQSADNQLNHYVNLDNDCWTINIEQQDNPFKDIF